MAWHGGRFRDRDATYLDLLSFILGEAESSRLRLSQSITGHGPTVFAEACRLGLEGIVSKRCGSRYPPGRSRSWLKSKNPDYGATVHAKHDRHE